MKTISKTRQVLLAVTALLVAGALVLGKTTIKIQKEVTMSF